MAVIVTLSFLWGIINIASTTAFNAVISFSESTETVMQDGLTTCSATACLNISYMLPIIVIAMRRVGDRPVQWGPWRLGRFGLAINCVAIVFVIFTPVFLLFPPYHELRQPGAWCRHDLCCALLVCLRQTQLPRPPSGSAGSGLSRALVDRLSVISILQLVESAIAVSTSRGPCGSDFYLRLHVRVM